MAQTKIDGILLVFSMRSTMIMVTPPLSVSYRPAHAHRIAVKHLRVASSPTASKKKSKMKNTVMNWEFYCSALRNDSRARPSFGTSEGDMTACESFHNSSTYDIEVKTIVERSKQLYCHSERRTEIARERARFPFFLFLNWTFLCNPILYRIINTCTSTEKAWIFTK